MHKVLLVGQVSFVQSYFLDGHYRYEVTMVNESLVKCAHKWICLVTVEEKNPIMFSSRNRN